MSLAAQSEDPCAVSLRDTHLVSYYCPGSSRTLERSPQRPRKLADQQLCSVLKELVNSKPTRTPLLELLEQVNSTSLKNRVWPCCTQI